MLKKAGRREIIIELVVVGLYTTLIFWIATTFFGIHKQPSIKALLLFCAVIVFLIFDLVARMYSRSVIREELKTSPLIICLIIIFDIIGVICYSNGANGFLSSFDFSFKNTALYYGIFCISTAIHNSLEIAADNSIGFVEYLKVSFSGDASEIPRTTERWAAPIKRLRKNLKRTIKNQYDYCKEAFKKVDLKDHRALRCILFYPFHLLKVLILAIAHGWIQMGAIHLCTLNFAVGVLIIFSPFNNLFTQLHINLRVLVVSVLLLFTLISYYVVSYNEMHRFIKNKERARAKEEERFQKIGNIFLLLTIAVLYLSLPKNILIVFFFIQQVIIAATVLLQPIVEKTMNHNKVVN